jgi:hypothetical protein
VRFHRAEIARMERYGCVHTTNEISHESVGTRKTKAANSFALSVASKLSNNTMPFASRSRSDHSRGETTNVGGGEGSIDLQQWIAAIWLGSQLRSPIT